MHARAESCHRFALSPRKVVDESPMRIVPSEKWRGDGRKVSILNVMAIFGSFVGRRPRCRIMPRDDVRAAAVRVTDTSPSPFSVPVIWLPAEAVEIEPEFEGRVSNGAETPVSQSDLDEYASAHGSAEEWEADYEDPDSSAFHLSIGAIPKSDRMQIHHETDAATHEQLVSAHAAQPARAQAPIQAPLPAPISIPAPQHSSTSATGRCNLGP